MWALHGVAAALTVALLYRGERAFLALLWLVGRAIRLARPPRLGFPPRPYSPNAFLSSERVSDRLWSAAAITHRGPPLLRLAR
jgi:hypothetical protein